MIQCGYCIVDSQLVGEGFFLLDIEYKSGSGLFFVQTRSFVEGLGIFLLDVIGVAVVSRYMLHILAPEFEPVHKWIRVF
jgi:hypothetical protein